MWSTSLTAHMHRLDVVGGGGQALCELYLACVFLFLVLDDSIFSLIYLFLANFVDFSRFSQPFGILASLFSIYCLIFPFLSFFSVFSAHPIRFFRRLGGGGWKPLQPSLCMYVTGASRPTRFVVCRCK